MLAIVMLSGLLPASKRLSAWRHAAERKARAAQNLRPAFFRPAACDVYLALSAKIAW
jgi:hypothetical protein